MLRRLAALSLAIALQGAICTAFACTTAIVGAKASGSGRPMIWKQRDTSNPFNVLVYVASSDGSYAYTAIFNADDTARKSVYAGANEAGFAIVNNLSYNLRSGEYKPANGTLMRRALETCSSVAEFEMLLRSENPRRCEANFAVLDASGACAFIEAADSTVIRYDVPEDGWMVRSNYSYAGKPDGGKGYARHQTAHALMSSHKGKFTPYFLIDGLGRSFYNDVLGYDAAKPLGRRYVYDEDFIARPTTTSSICFDGGDQMWVAIGYTPAALAIPVKVSDGDNLPSCLTPSADGKAPANVLAEELKCRMHPLSRDAAGKYIDLKALRKIRRTVRKYDREMESLYMKGEATPGKIDELYEKFKKETE